NAIIRQFSSRGISSVNGAGSQALIELKAAYCDQFRCLDCMVGKAILERYIYIFINLREKQYLLLYQDECFLLPDRYVLHAPESSFVYHLRENLPENEMLN